MINLQNVARARRWFEFAAGLIGNIAYAIFCILVIPAMLAVFYIMVS